MLFYLASGVVFVKCTGLYDTTETNDRFTG